jgi:structural maintenance of chromosome 2
VFGACCTSSNLSQVRAGSLQDLVYKSGQAGVTRASVTIVFNNEDTAQSPVGYEQYERITITRQVCWVNCRFRGIFRAPLNTGCALLLRVVLQVVIGGRNKYLINGHNAKLNRVQNLFHSVQLNVNNPHFLIMQVRTHAVSLCTPR